MLKRHMGMPEILDMARAAPPCRHALHAATAPGGHARPEASWNGLLAQVARSSEFENIVPREEEMPELEALARSRAVAVDVKGGLASKEGKANALLQAHPPAAQQQPQSAGPIQS